MVYTKLSCGGLPLSLRCRQATRPPAKLAGRLADVIVLLHRKQHVAACPWPASERLPAYRHEQSANVFPKAGITAVYSTCGEARQNQSGNQEVMMPQKTSLESERMMLDSGRSSTKPCWVLNSQTACRQLARAPSQRTCVCSHLTQSGKHGTSEL